MKFLLKNFRAESINITTSKTTLTNSARSNSVVAPNCINSKDAKTLLHTNKRNKLNFMQHFTKKSPIGMKKKVFFYIINNNILYANLYFFLLVLKN